MTHDTFFINSLDTFDILWRDIFDNRSVFGPLPDVKINSPVDVIKRESGNLEFHIAAPGSKKSDIDINIEDDVLRVEKKKEEDNIDGEFLSRNISRKAFKHAWKLSQRFDLEKARAYMEDGLLVIEVPVAESKKKKTISID